MKRLVLLCLALLLLGGDAIPQTPQQTYIELGLYWGDFGSSPQVTNATTTITDSHGNTVATMTGAWPHATLTLPFDLYTITVTAPAANGHPAVNYNTLLFLATVIPQTSYVVSRYEANFAFDSTGQHGKLTFNGAATF